MILIHPSSLSKIMADAQSIDPRLLDTKELKELYAKRKKTDEEKQILEPLWGKSLSAGAKTYLNGLAKEIVYGYREQINTKYMEKGILVEQQSIDLYNEVNFTCHSKNTERLEDGLLCGECDIRDDDCIIDIKSAWSLPTFPATAAMAHDPDYEWQLRGYMRLWNRPFAELAFCLVDTPDELMRYEDPRIHKVSHIEPQMRVTKVRYTRDMDIEARIETKCRAAQQYVQEVCETIVREHSY